MKTLTIRLEKQDLKNIETLQADNNVYSTSTINSTIRQALKLAVQHQELKQHINALFVEQWTVDQKKLHELNKKFGLLQRSFF